MVLAMTLEHLALNVHATGFADYGGCHSDTWVGKPTEGCIAGKTVERHRRRNGSTRKARCRKWSKLGDGQYYRQPVFGFNFDRQRACIEFGVVKGPLLQKRIVPRFIRNSNPVVQFKEDDDLPLDFNIFATGKHRYRLYYELSLSISDIGLRHRCLRIVGYTMVPI
jgi:hypothetical protein